jgi:hypothetical protein
MSKIRTLSQLQEAMQAEFAWRKKELASLETMVVQNEHSRRREFCLRAAIPLLYAHWEGFVKKIGDFYVEFVARQKLKNKDIGPSFLAAAMGQQMKANAGTHKVGPWMDIVAMFRTRAESKCELKWKGAIRTRANLSSEVFREIVTALGLDYRQYETKEKLVDERLLANRNSIAHGRYLLVDFAEYITLHGEMLGMMQLFYDQVTNAAVLQQYRATLP